MDRVAVMTRVVAQTVRRRGAAGTPRRAGRPYGALVPGKGLGGHVGQQSGADDGSADQDPIQGP
jgi:hypothetical protein